MFWGLVRVAGIIVGVATLLRLATAEGFVTYDAVFQAWMDRLRDFLELGFLTDLIEPFLHWGIEYARNFGMTVPPLQEIWRPAFVLSALMFEALARHNGVWWLRLAAPLGALAVAVWSGLIGWLAPVGLFASFVAGATVVVAVATATSVGSAIAAVAVGAVFLFVVGFAAMVSPGPPAAAIPIIIAGMIAASAIVLLLIGIGEGRQGGWRALFDSARFKSGVDILGAMGAALALAVMFADPPLF